MNTAGTVIVIIVAIIAAIFLIPWIIYLISNGINSKFDAPMAGKIASACDKICLINLIVRKIKGNSVDGGYYDTQFEPVETSFAPITGGNRDICFNDKCNF